MIYLEVANTDTDFGCPWATTATTAITCYYHNMHHKLKGVATHVNRAVMHAMVIGKINCGLRSSMLMSQI